MPGFFVNPKSQVLNPNSQLYTPFHIIGLIIAGSYSVTNKPKKIYDLKQRTFLFTKNVIKYVDKLPRKISGIEIGRQLIRSAGSVGANYIEADEALSRKDFIMRIKICRKEAKESKYWLELSAPDTRNIELKAHLIDECTQLIKIFSTIIKKANP